MLKKTTKKIKDAIELHVAGATVNHAGRFSGLDVMQNHESMDQDFINRYVIPFYMERIGSEKFKSSYIEIRNTIDLNLASKLLGEFNWRPRSVGARFAAIEEMTELEKNIGHLLLRSDVCYAGHSYCLALASFSTTNSINFLNQYLEYYLQKTELWFDQNSAMAALAYLGNQTDKSFIDPHMQSWESFVRDKPNWNLEHFIEGFNNQMEDLIKLRHQFNNQG